MILINVKIENFLSIVVMNTFNISLYKWQLQYNTLIDLTLLQVFITKVSQLLAIRQVVPAVEYIPIEVFIEFVLFFHCYPQDW